MPALKHIHQYIFMERKNNEDYYRCKHPHCTHFTSRAKIVDKVSMCSKCGDKEVLLTYKQLNARKNPLCLDCQNTRQAKTFKETKNLMDQLMNQQQIQEIEKYDGDGDSDDNTLMETINDIDNNNNSSI